jgi:secretion/DNA translocation related TadE-like protein
MTSSRHRGEAGSVTVLAAAVLFLGAALCLIGVDILRALQARARAQTAADAAALAAAQEIAIPSGVLPMDLARDYAARNGGILVECRCEPGTSEAVVAVEVPITLVFVGPSRTTTARARAVIEGSAQPRSNRADRPMSQPAPEELPEDSLGTGRCPQSAGTMAANGDRETAPGAARREAVERAAEVARSGRLHAGQAGPHPQLPPGPPLQVRHLRRSPGAPPGGALSGSRGQPSLPRVPQLRTSAPGLCLCGEPEPRQRQGLPSRRRPGPGRGPAGRCLLRGRGLHELLLEPSGGSVSGSNGRLTTVPVTKSRHLLLHQHGEYDHNPWVHCLT